MKTASNYFISAAAVLLMLSSCGDSETASELSGRASPDFTATIDGVHSRAFGSTWDAADEIGISGCGRTNVCYITASGNGTFAVKTAGDQIYFQNEDLQTFTAYYPWTSIAEGGTTFTADTRMQGEQKTFDFLWGQGTGRKDAPEVAINFTHRMAKVMFTLRPGEGVTFDEVKAATFSLGNVSMTGSFNIADGSTTVAAPETSWAFSEIAQYDETANTATFSLILFPQVFENAVPFDAELDLPDTQSHHMRADIDFTAANREKDGENAKNEWVAGRQYNLGMTIHKTSVVVDGCQITPWSEVNGEYVVD